MSKQLFIINTLDASDLKVYKEGVELTAITADANAGIAAATVLEQVAGAEIAFYANGRTSVDVDAGELRRAEKLTYSAGQKQVWKVDLSGLGGEEGCIKVIVTTPGTANLPMYTFCAKTAAEFAAAKDEFEITVDGDTATITAELNQHVRIACSAILEGVVASADTTFVPTTGTAADIAALEEAFLPYEGITNKVGFPVIKPNSNVKADEVYDIVVADFVTVSNAKHGMNALKGEKIKLMFACKVDTTARDADASSASNEILDALANLK